MNTDSLLMGVIDVVVVGTDSARCALMKICGCEQCSSAAVMPFERILDHFLSTRGGLVTYVLAESMVCPNCETPLNETTPVEAVRNWREPVPRTEMVLVDERAIVQAQSLMSACERCEDGATISFDYLLDAVITACDPSETEYLMCRRARCPGCSNEVGEKTLIIPK